MMDAALELSIIQPSIVAYGCTSGSFMNGVGSDHEIAERIRQEVESLGLRKRVVGDGGTLGVSLKV